MFQTKKNKKSAMGGLGNIQYMFGDKKAPPVKLDPSLKQLVENLEKVPVSYQNVAALIKGNENHLVARAKAILQETCPSINTNAALLSFNEQQILGNDSTGAAIVRPCLNIVMSSAYDYIDPEDRHLKGVEKLFSLRIPFHNNEYLTFEVDATTQTQNGFEPSKVSISGPTSCLAINDPNIVDLLGFDDFSSVEKIEKPRSYILLNSQNLDFNNVYYEEGSALLAGSRFMDIIVNALAMAVGEIVTLLEIQNMNEALDDIGGTIGGKIEEYYDMPIFADPQGVTLSQKDYILKGREAMLVGSMLPEASAIYQMIDVFTRDLFYEMGSGIEAILAIMKDFDRNLLEDRDKDINTIIRDMVLMGELPEVFISSLDTEVQVWRAGNYLKLLGAKALRAFMKNIELQNVLVEINNTSGTPIDVGTIISIDSNMENPTEITAISSEQAITAIPLNDMPKIMNSLMDNFEIALTQSLGDGLTYNLNVLGLRILAEKAIKELDAIDETSKKTLRMVGRVVGDATMDKKKGVNKAAIAYEILKPAIYYGTNKLAENMIPINNDAQVNRNVREAQEDEAMLGQMMQDIIYRPCMENQKEILFKSIEIEDDAEGAAVALQEAQSKSMEVAMGPDVETAPTTPTTPTTPEVAKQQEIENKQKIESAMTKAEELVKNVINNAKQVENKAIIAIDETKKAKANINATNLPEPIKEVVVSQLEANIDTNLRIKQGAIKAQQNAQQLLSQRDRLKNFNKAVEGRKNSIGSIIAKFLIGGALTYGAYRLLFSKKKNNNDYGYGN